MRPFVIKTHFYLPGSKGKTSMQAAVGHLKYMVNSERHTSAKGSSGGGGCASTPRSPRPTSSTRPTPA
jgi:hypothetical protein